MNELALKDLLYRMADDELISGHRMSEWCGTAPLLEEDLAFSSIGQDKLGHSLQLFTYLHELGEPDPDTNGFRRNWNHFLSCQLVELPIGNYAFSLMRHFLFDNSEFLRYKLLKESSFEPLAKFSVKAVSELRYHVMHANEWIKKLGNSSDEAIELLQKSLNELAPYALGMFEKSKYEDVIIDEKFFQGEDILKNQWFDSITPILKKTKLTIPDFNAVIGGSRYGKHSIHLEPLITEMTEVISSESNEIDW